MPVRPRNGRENRLSTAMAHIHIEDHSRAREITPSQRRNAIVRPVIKLLGMAELERRKSRLKPGLSQTKHHGLSEQNPHDPS